MNWRLCTWGRNLNRERDSRETTPSEDSHRIEDKGLFPEDRNPVDMLPGQDMTGTDLENEETRLNAIEHELQEGIHLTFHAVLDADVETVTRTRGRVKRSRS